jgi:CoA-dependent NAD(P)H sulfur oxidoreductase
MTIDQVFDLDLAYAPPFSPVYDPVLLAARVARKKK